MALDSRRFSSAMIDFGAALIQKYPGFAYRADAIPLDDKQTRMTESIIVEMARGVGLDMAMLQERGVIIPNPAATTSTGASPKLLDLQKLHELAGEASATPAPGAVADQSPFPR